MVFSNQFRHSPIFLLLCTIASFESIAQTVISLEKEKIASLTPVFSITEIIDARSEKNWIGIVQKGLSNRKELARFKNDLQTEFLALINGSIDKNKSLTGLVMRVVKATINERTLLTSETANAELIVEFYMERDQQLYLLKSVASNKTSYGADVTGKHGKNISDCLEECLSQVNDHLANGYAFESRNAVSRPLLSRVPIVTDTFSYPILTADSLQAGIYKNFIEFRNNLPTLGQNFSVKKKRNDFGQYFKAQRQDLLVDGQKVENIWGYSDGQKIFIKLGEEFFEVFIEDGFFWFLGYELSNFEVDLVPASALLSAFTGFALSLNYNVQSKQRKYVINLGNGDLFPLAD